MMSSLDGRIDGEALAAVSRDGEYEATGATLKGDAWVCGRTTMQMHFAEKKPFISKSKKPAGRTPVFVGRAARSYAVCIDTHGKLRWDSNDIDGDHLICVLSEQTSEDYLAMLRDKKISYVVAGRPSVDLGAAMKKLRTDFGIRRLLLEGGGHINGGFLEAGLIDEVSILLAPGIDGRKGLPTVFDGVRPSRKRAAPLKLQSVKQRRAGLLWLRYKISSKHG
ncbi:MAG: bifunctional deaminase-reductase domain protein [Spartobacteria bacterium]|nr:bifunctional deaminase-reductase domain protein [Spartobacteria bacterium]